MPLLDQLYVSVGENNPHICTRQELQSAEFLSKLFLLFIRSFSALIISDRGWVQDVADGMSSIFEAGTTRL